MKLYRIKVTYGYYSAPSIYVEASDDKNAIKEAKQNSGLGRFKEWYFIPTAVKDIQERKQRKTEA